jgi:tetratricopeptide (TPR) repeat protein
MMNRVTAYVALLGGFVAALALYLIDPLRDPAIAQQADPESWPTCTSMAASDGPAWAPLDPDFAAGKRALAARDWDGAIRALESAALRHTRNADLQNYLGYAYGRLRHFENAVRHYEQALTLNVRHRGAHQHLGETYLVVGDLVKAAEHLAELERICLISCQEHDNLKRAIGEYKKTAAVH